MGKYFGSCGRPIHDWRFCRIVAPPAATPSAVSGRWPASSLCLIPRVWCSRLPAAALIASGFRRVRHQLQRGDQRAERGQSAHIATQNKKSRRTRRLSRMSERCESCLCCKRDRERSVDEGGTRCRRILIPRVRLRGKSPLHWKMASPGLKEAILILASATVQNGAAHGQPRRGAGAERSEEILRCAGLSSLGCHAVFHRPAFGSAVRTVRAMVDSMLLDRIDGIRRLMKSLLFRAHRRVGVSRLPRGSPSTASKSTTGTTPLACVHGSDSRAARSGVDAMYASGVQCETRASSPPCSLKRSKCRTASAPACPLSHKSIGDPSLRICRRRVAGFPRLQRVNLRCLAAAGEREPMVDLIVESPHRHAQQRRFWEQALDSPWAGSRRWPLDSCFSCVGLLHGQRRRSPSSHLSCQASMRL